MKKMRKVLGLLIGAAMAISAGTTGFAVDYEDEDPILPPIYGLEYYNHAQLTYEKLMAMSDEEFALYDRPTIPVEQDNYIVGGQSRFRCIQAIIRGIGDRQTYDIEEIPEDIHKELGLSSEYLAVIQYPDKDGLDKDMYVKNVYWALRRLRPEFELCGENYDARYIEDVDAGKTTVETLVHDLNKLLEGNIGFTVTEYKRSRGDLTDIYIEFDVDECYEINQENVLYYARLYYILTSINPAIHYSKENLLAESDSKDEIACAKEYSRYLNGDSNGDSKLDVFDAVNIAKYTVNAVKFDEEQMIRSDVNKDDKIDVFDAIAVAKKTVE